MKEIWKDIEGYENEYQVRALSQKRINNLKVAKPENMTKSRLSMAQVYPNQNEQNCLLLRKRT